MNETKPLIEVLKCDLTNDELLKYGGELANQTAALSQIQNEKKRVTSDFAAKIQAAEATIAILTNKVQTKAEYRDVPCRAIYDSPQPGWKTIVRNDTHTVVKEERMSQEEMQRALEFPA